MVLSPHRLKDSRPAWARLSALTARGGSGRMESSGNRTRASHVNAEYVHTTPQHLKYTYSHSKIMFWSIVEFYQSMWALKLLLHCEHLLVLTTFSFFHTLFTIYSFVFNTFQHRLLAEETAARCQTSDLPQSCLSLQPAFCYQPSKFILPSSW